MEELFFIALIQFCRLSKCRPLNVQQVDVFKCTVHTKSISIPSSFNSAFDESVFDATAFDA